MILFSRWLFRKPRQKIPPPNWNEPFEVKLLYFRDKQVQGFLDYSWSMRNHYRRLNTLTVIAGLALSAATTVVGTIGNPPFAGILGAIITFLLGIQNAFRFAQNASIWELKHGEAKGIRDRLIYRVKDETEFNQVVDDWIKFREGLL
jgi:hypothetical protein